MVITKFINIFLILIIIASYPILAQKTGEVSLADSALSELKSTSKHIEKYNIGLQREVNDISKQLKYLKITVEQKHKLNVLIESKKDTIATINFFITKLDSLHYYIEKYNYRRCSYEDSLKIIERLNNIYYETVAFFEKQYPSNKEMDTKVDNIILLQ